MSAEKDQNLTPSLSEPLEAQKFALVPTIRMPIQTKEQLM
jgi:hypothetical protein